MGVNISLQNGHNNLIYRFVKHTNTQTSPINKAKTMHEMMIFYFILVSAPSDRIPHNTIWIHNNSNNEMIGTIKFDINIDIDNSTLGRQNGKVQNTKTNSESTISKKKQKGSPKIKWKNENDGEEGKGGEEQEDEAKTTTFKIHRNKFFIQCCRLNIIVDGRARISSIAGRLAGWCSWLAHIVFDRQSSIHVFVSSNLIKLSAHYNRTLIIITRWMRISKQS